jgi:branched-chain amino acid transport system permease protein
LLARAFGVRQDAGSGAVGGLWGCGAGVVGVTVDVASVLLAALFDVVGHVPIASVVGDFVEFLSPSNLAGVLVDGLAKAAVFALIAVGLTLIFGLMGVLNFAHGSFTIVGAYVAGLAMVLIVSTGDGIVTRVALFFVAVVVAFAAVAALGGVIETKLIRPLYDRPPLYQILLTFGLTLVIDELVRMVVDFYGLQPRSAWQEALGTRPDWFRENHTYFGLTVEGMDLFEIFLGVAVIAAVWLFLTRTRYGLFIRAGSEDAEMAEALGVDVRRVFTVVFGIGAGLTGVAGALLMWDPGWGASVTVGAEALLPAFVVVIVGGLGTFKGTVVAALVVGLADATMTWWFQNVLVTMSWLPEVVVFAILVGVLIVKPRGLYGVQEVGGH